MKKGKKEIMAVKSTSNKAKGIIRREIAAYDWNAKKLKDQIDSFNTYPRHVRPATPYHAGRKLVEGGCFACYYPETDEMLGRIYGKDKVKKWSNEKKWDTYTHLLSREINSIYNTGKMSLATANKKRISRK